MQTIKVLGTGCANCNATMKLIESVSNEKGIEVSLEKVEELSDIMAYGVMSTPGVVIDDKVVHSGGVPDRQTVEGWISGNTGCCSGNSSENTGSSCCG